MAYEDSKYFLCGLGERLLTTYSVHMGSTNNHTIATTAVDIKHICLLRHL